MLKNANDKTAKTAIIITIAIITLFFILYYVFIDLNIFGI
jgi:hypothetical protein